MPALHLSSMKLITYRTVFFCLFFFLPGFAALAEAGPASRVSSISYNIVPDYRNSQRLQVSFAYTTDKNGKLVLRYENDSWGDQDIFNCIASFEVLPNSANIRFLPDSSLIIIEALPLQQLQISYAIKQDFSEPVLNKQRNRPIIQQEYFHLLGMRLFITPDEIFGDGSQRAGIEMRWKAPEPGTIFHSSFGSDLHQIINTTREELYASFFVGGDFRRYSFNFDGQEVYFVTRGQWRSFTEEAVFSLLKSTIPAQMDFWQDTLKAPFSVSLLPTNEVWTEKSKANSLGGSGLTHSFVSFASNNPGTSLSKITWLYNHELLHRWIGQAIRNQEEEKQYWFSEGFTEYYAYKLMLKSKALDVNAYIDAINTDIFAAHYKSAVNNIPNDAISREKFWSDYNYHKLPYRRGFIYAFLLDLQLKKLYKGKKGLDQLMLDIFATAKANPAQLFNHELFEKVLLQYMDAEAVAAFHKHIIGGALIELGKTKALPKGLAVVEVGKIPVLAIDAKSNTKKLSRYLSK